MKKFRQNPCNFVDANLHRLQIFTNNYFEEHLRTAACLLNNNNDTIRKSTTTLT